MVKQLNLTNTEVRRGRVEELPKKDLWFCYRTGGKRPSFETVQDKIAKGAKHSPANGILYLKEATIQKS